MAVAGESLRPAMAGLTAGLIVAWTLSGVVRATMFGWESSAPLSMAAVSALMAMVAVVAIVGPARRVLSIDPSATLRAE
jgi:ABC-type antimicrobial peptide transport system permease subunit